MPRLLLVRHGRTAWNLAGRGQGQTDVPLDEVGRQQAAEAGPELAHMQPDAVWASDLSRAYDTALAIGLPVTADKRLREIDLGRYEGLTQAEWEADDPEAYAQWRGGYDVRRGGGETYAEVGARAMEAVREGLEEITDPWGLLVVVAHGGTIRALLTELLALPPSPWAQLGALDNLGCAYLVDAPDGRGWRLVQYGVRPAFLRRPSSG